MKCDYCKKERPKFWNQFGKWCDSECFKKWKREKELRQAKKEMGELAEKSNKDIM